MKRKLIGTVVVTLLITTAIPVTGLIKEKNQYDTNLFETQKVIPHNVYRSETSNNNDQLDQYYTHNAYARNIGNATLKLAQTFKPSYPTITRLELLLKKEESGPTDFSIYILRLNNGVPGGTVSQIYQTYFNSDILFTGTYWYEFDILDQCVLPGATYHIEIFGTAPTTYTTNLRWCFGFEEPYTNGDAYQYSHSEWKIIDFSGRPCDFCFKTYGTDFGGNHPPSIPSTPSGPSTGKIGTSYSYSTSSTDPDGDQIRYGFDWTGDGIPIWSGFKNSGDSCLKSYTWSNVGTYQVRVKAQDEHGRESGWSDPLSVTIPKSKNKAINTPFLNFLENHPHLFPILRHLLGL